jgi:hypothetical protein
MSCKLACIEPEYEYIEIWEVTLEIVKAIMHRKREGSNINYLSLIYSL